MSHPSTRKRLFATITSLVMTAVGCIAPAAFAQDVDWGYTGWHPYGDISERRWYDNGVMAQSKEFYDPGSQAWYWADADGSIAHDKDVYQPGKWVRYDYEGHMIKGEDFRYGGWYYFDLTTGAMTHGTAFIPSNGGKWVYYDWTTGQMAHGERYLNYDSSHTGWYYFDPATGAMFHGDTFVRSNGGKWVRYDRTTVQMVHGLQYQDGAWYYFDPVTGAMAHGNTYVPQWHGWYFFDQVTGRYTPQHTASAPHNTDTVYYENCAAVRKAGKAPLHRGDPGYRSGLDGDGDGVACEPYRRR